MVADSAAATKSVSLKSGWLDAPAPTQGLEIIFRTDPTVYDGRFANNGWLHETPDPITKVVWGNVASLSAATAKELGVADGDVISITRGSYSVEIPAMVQPGHADNSISLSLGHGRTKVGRVGAEIDTRNTTSIRLVEALGFTRVAMTPNADFTVWTLKLKPGIKFTDGTPFDGNAVKFNITRVLAPATKSSAFAQMSAIDSVQVIDPTRQLSSAASSNTVQIS